MFDKGRVNEEQVKEVVEYLEDIPDMPKDFHKDRKRLFGL